MSEQTTKQWKSRVVLMISSFKYDDAVLTILKDVRANANGAFDKIIVVDSIGTGRMPERLREEGFDDVDYFCAAENLGAAGNHAERLKRAAAHGADFAYAVNHDGHVELDTVKKLVTCAEQITNVGAVYPIRRYTRRDGQFDVSARSSIPVPVFGRKNKPKEPIVEVHWGASNGALYAIAPVRAGLLPWTDLWHGWEDLGYGWLLREHGYRQVMLTDAVFDDDFEYEPHKIGPFTLHLTEKPPWYAYYSMRNLTMVTQRYNHSLGAYAMLAERIAQEVALTTLFRDNKMERYEMIARGIVDGVRKRGGKWKLP